jgi:peptide/nickel transport system substrate-binding protein
MPARPSALPLSFLAAALVAGALTGGAAARPVAGDAQSPRSGGTLVVGLAPEPRTLNAWLPAGLSPATFEVAVTTMDTGMRLDARGRPQPLLLAAPPRIVRRNPLTVRFSYRQSARWSDGRPLTGRDFVFAWRTATDPRWSSPMRPMWDEIRRVQVSGRGAKTVTVTYRRPTALWLSAPSMMVLPAHALGGESFDGVWRTNVNDPRTGRPISNAPFLFERWEPGRQISVVRNPSYWGRKAYLQRIVFRVFPGVDALLAALRAGEIDLAAPPAHPQIAELRRDRRFRVLSGPAYNWEHVAFQQGPSGHPALKRAYVRRAIVTAINRRQIARSAYGAIAPDLPVLDNAIFKPFERGYRPNWAVHRFGQQRAIDLLRRNGCTGGPARPGAGGVYSCSGVGRLSFRFTTTSGHAARETAFRIMRAQLASIGIELQQRFVPQPQFVGLIQGGDWDLVMFTWAGSPIAAANSGPVFACGGQSNFAGYCNRAVTTLLERARSTFDDRERAAILNRADALMARDAPVIPLYSLPGFVVHRTNVGGVFRSVWGGSGSSYFGSAGDWWLRR